MKKRKSRLAFDLKRLDKIGESLQGVILDKNPKIAEIELQALEIAHRVKKEGITSA